ncbi:MAG: septum formation family protein [Actinomycetota bacterium]
MAALVLLRDGGDTVAADPPSGPDVNSLTGDPNDDNGSTDEPTNDPAAATDDRTSGDVIAKDLRTGDCFSLPNTAGIFDTVALRSCDESHDGEVVAILEHPGAGGEYPGIDDLLEYATFPCAEGFQQYVGTNDEFLTELQSGALYPTFDEWQDGIFVIPCFASRWDEETLDFSVRDRGDDPAVNLEFGDLNGLDRLYPGDCFNEVDDGLLLVPVRQTVELADCEEINEGEVVGFIDLEGPDGGYDQDALFDEALATCTPVYADYTGIELTDDIGLNGIVPSNGEWAGSTRFGVCVVLKVEGGEAGSIAG